MESAKTKVSMRKMMNNLFAEGVRGFISRAPLWVRVVISTVFWFITTFWTRFSDGGFFIILWVLISVGVTVWAILGVFRRDTIIVRGGKHHTRMNKVFAFIFVAVPVLVVGGVQGYNLALAISPYSAEEIAAQEAAEAERAAAKAIADAERQAERERKAAEKASADAEKAEAAAEKERQAEAEARRQKLAEEQEAAERATEGALQVIQANVELDDSRSMEEWSEILGIDLPDRDTFNQMLAEDLANSLTLSFDNFQCFDPTGCKAVYNVRYTGSYTEHRAFTPFGSIQGHFSGVEGPDAAVNSLVWSNSNGLTYPGDRFQRNETYTLLINVYSVDGAKYDSVVVMKDGVPIISETFGCYQAQKSLFAESPTC
jgi:hypothetical protein